MQLVKYKFTSKLYVRAPAETYQESHRQTLFFCQRLSSISSEQRPHAKTESVPTAAVPYNRRSKVSAAGGRMCVRRAAEKRVRQWRPAGASMNVTLATGQEEQHRGTGLEITSDNVPSEERSPASAIARYSSLAGKQLAVCRSNWSVAIGPEQRCHAPGSSNGSRAARRMPE
jgi:hypothetical protein